MQRTKPVTKPSKQRKMLFQLPDHRRVKLFSARLTPELRSTHKVKTVPVKSGDSVRIVRGEHKGFEGKITRVDRMKYRVFVEGLTREKVDGTTIFVPIHPSKVVVTRLNLDDKWRKTVLEERGKAAKKRAAVEEKPTEKVVEVKEAVTEELPIEEKVVEEKVKEKKPRRAKREAKTPEKEKAETPKPRAKRKTARKKTKKSEKTPEEGGA